MKLTTPQREALVGFLKYTQETGKTVVTFAEVFPRRNNQDNGMRRCLNGLYRKGLFDVVAGQGYFLNIGGVTLARELALLTND